MDQQLPDISPVWAALHEGVAPGRSPFSMIYLATLGMDGAPKIRTVVIRRLDAKAGSVGFNTDTRAPKFAEMQADDRVSVLAYDMGAGIQIRLEGEAVLHSSGAVQEAAWAASAAQSRICYRHAYAPGTPLRLPELGDPDISMKAPDDPDAGREHFCAVDMRISRIDHLDLRQGGHRRAIFDRSQNGWSGRWVAP